MAGKVQKEKILLILDANFRNCDFNVTQMADILCISQTYLYERVYFLFGKCPKQLLDDYRLKRAIKLMTNKNTLVKIGFEVGFSCPRSFRRAFVNRFYVSPNKFYQFLKTKKCKYFCYITNLFLNYNG